MGQLDQTDGNATDGAPIEGSTAEATVAAHDNDYEENEHVVTLSPADFAALDPSEVTVIDVREHSELAAGAIPGSINIPLGTLGERLGKIPLDRPVAVYCRSGKRGSRAASLLANRGYEAFNLAGGYTAFAEYLEQEKKRRSNE